MKAKLIFTIVLMTITSSISAQFTNSGTTNTSGNISSNVNTDGWQKIYISYNPLKAVIDVSGADDLDFTGFSIGYNKSYSISNDFPLFVETGIEATYAFKTIDKDDNEELDTYYGEMEQKMTYLSANIPVNLAYKFTLSDKNISIIPYLGVNLKGNIIAKSKHEFVEFEDDYYYDSEKDFWEDQEEEGYKQDMNYFDKKDVGKDNQWKRIQFGWQIGIGLYYNQLYIGLEYGKDLSELYKKTQISKTSITLGYSF